MTTTTRPATPAPASTSKFSLEEQERRKTRLMDILSRGLPTLPNYVLDLNVLLGQSAVDLKKVGNIIRTDPSLTSQVLRLCNSALFGLRHRVVSIEQAAILLGTERLRTLVLTCSVMQFAGKRLPKAQLTRFWHHSFLCALLSERLASHLHYCEKEQAYLGGLLHDIGLLPMCILVIGEETAHRTPPPLDWMDNVAIERDYFGMDHCKVGRWMGVSWNYMPSFVDIFQYHHAPERAQHDPYLVGLIAAADQFLIAHGQDFNPSNGASPEGSASGSSAEPSAAPSADPSSTAPAMPVPPAVVPANARTAAPLGTASANGLPALVSRPAAPPRSPARSSSPRVQLPSTERPTAADPAAETSPSESSDALPPAQELPPFFQKCLPDLDESEHRAVFEMMQTEYLHLVPLVQLGMSIAASDDV